MSESSNMTKGLAAMEMMYKEKPNEYVRTVLSVMPYVRRDARCR
jgi:hypothetical protein